MSAISRRQLLQGLLGGLLGTVGTVVLASAALGTTEAEAAAPPTENVEERADRVAEELGPIPEDEGEFTSFLNGGFLNGLGGGFPGRFRNGGFGPGGFYNGAFRNGGFGPGHFRNGGFPNGGWDGWGGGFRNGGFGNGGWDGGWGRRGVFLNF
jgi:rSAM-associated Gly-rich repeat protein